MDIPSRVDNLRDDAIGMAREAFVGALESGDARAASASYTTDARLLTPSAELFRGRAAIERFWMAGLDTGISEVVLETLELVRRNGFAYEIGRYELGLRPADDRPVVDRGKYVRVHEQQPDGSWLWALEMFNPDGASPRERNTGSRRGAQRQ
jgi:ketosteroid isomerase-like protein